MSSFLKTKVKCIDMTKSSPLNYQSSVYQSEETNVVYIIILTDHHLMIMYETPKEGPVKEAKTSVEVYQLKNSFFSFFFCMLLFTYFQENYKYLNSHFFLTTFVLSFKKKWQQQFTVYLTFVRL